MRVNEIFGSIDGEGKRTGRLTTFVRLTGCNLRCVYCDTEYAFTSGKEMSIDDIVSECKGIGYHNITLTGGEPLIHKDSLKLIKALCLSGFQVNIETNGSLDLTEFINEREANNLDFFLTVDYKCKYSGQSNLMNENSFKLLDPKLDLVKCVVASREDMDLALQYLDRFDLNIWFSPVFGKIEPEELVNYIKEHRREDITVQVQLHKIIWDPAKRGV